MTEEIAVRQPCSESPERFNRVRVQEGIANPAHVFYVSKGIRGMASVQLVAYQSRAEAETISYKEAQTSIFRVQDSPSSRQSSGPRLRKGLCLR